jgi:CRP-like cAMP-binding protein
MVPKTRGQPLTDKERAPLAVGATIVRFKRGETIFNEGDAAAAVFSIIGGVIKLYRVHPNQNEHIVRFMYQNDLIGLAEHGRYINSAKSITPSILFKMPTQTLYCRKRRIQRADRRCGAAGMRGRQPAASF